MSIFSGLGSKHSEPSIRHHLIQDVVDIWSKLSAETWRSFESPIITYRTGLQEGVFKHRSKLFQHWLRMLTYFLAVSEEICFRF